MFCVNKKGLKKKLKILAFRKPIAVHPFWAAARYLPVPVGDPSQRDRPLPLTPPTGSRESTDPVRDSGRAPCPRVGLRKALGVSRQPRPHPFGHMSRRSSRRTLRHLLAQLYGPRSATPRLLSHSSPPCPLPVSRLLAGAPAIITWLLHPGPLRSLSLSQHGGLRWVSGRVRPRSGLPSHSPSLIHWFPGVGEWAALLSFGFDGCGRLAAWPR